MDPKIVWQNGFLFDAMRLAIKRRECASWGGHTHTDTDAHTRTYIQTVTHTRTDAHTHRAGPSTFGALGKLHSWRPPEKKNKLLNSSTQWRNVVTTGPGVGYYDWP